MQITIFSKYAGNDLKRSTYFSVYREDRTNGDWLQRAVMTEQGPRYTGQQSYRILSGVSFRDATNCEKIVGLTKLTKVVNLLISTGTICVGDNIKEFGCSMLSKN